MIQKQLKKFFNPKLTGKTIDPKRTKKAVLFYNPSKKRAFVFKVGSGLFIIGLASFLYFYLPLLTAYTNYYRLPKTQENVLIKPTPIPEQSVDYEDFYLSIPKINASAQVFANILPNNKDEYLEVLKKGIAHAKGTGFPGEGNTVYLFAHSTNNSYNIVRYNAVFFLLDKLGADDDIIVFFNNEIYKYKVFEKVIVNADQAEYLSYKGEKETLILQTCWPPGTIWKRLLVLAERQD